MTPWSTASIRVRLTAWYAVALSLMLVVYATATFVAVRHEFVEQLDELNLPRFNRHPISHESAIGVCHGETEAAVVLSGV